MANKSGKTGIPPDPIYRLGKRKERVSKSVAMLELVMMDASLYGSNGPLISQISKMIDSLKDYRIKLDLP